MAPRPELNLVDQVMASARNFYGRITLLISLIILYNFHESWLLIRFKYLFIYIYIYPMISSIYPLIYIYIYIFIFIYLLMYFICLFMDVLIYVFIPILIACPFSFVKSPHFYPAFHRAPRHGTVPTATKAGTSSSFTCGNWGGNSSPNPIPSGNSLHHVRSMLDHVRSIKVHINPYQSWLPSGELT